MGMETDIDMEIGMEMVRHIRMDVDIGLHIDMSLDMDIHMDMSMDMDVYIDIVHVHQKQWLEIFAQHATEVGEALLKDGACNWNHKKNKQPCAEEDTEVMNQQRLFS